MDQCATHVIIKHKAKGLYNRKPGAFHSATATEYQGVFRYQGRPLRFLWRSHPLAHFYCYCYCLSENFSPTEYIHVLTAATEYQGIFHTAFFQASAYILFPNTFSD